MIGNGGESRRVRGFLLDEVVRAADALSREALAELTATPAARALDALPAPGLIKSVVRDDAPP